MSTTIDAVRGMRDVPPREFETQAAVTARIERVLASYGYQPIDLPIVERRDLYLRKLGEELIGKVYEFTFSGRELALRPEWTASVLRSYVGRMQDQPLPLRLRYHGPVFRNERPQRATYRQFTQLGVELIGGPAPRADAECIALACAGLDAAGLDSYQVLLGHIGFIRNVLTELGLAERTQGLLVWSLERMRKEGVDAVRTLLDDDDGELPFDAALLDGLDDARAEALLIHSLKTIGVNLQFGTRPPEAIVGRLVRKLRRGESRASVDQALALLQQLSMLKGPASQALPQAEALLRDFNLPAHGLDELRAVLDLVVAHGVDTERLVIDVGLGRGLHYYTGIIFEIYADDGLQLCGGGRYDDLVTALGGRRQTPAVGFSYGVERVVASLSRPPAQAVPAATALVVAETDSAYPYALEVAQALRERGFITTVDVRGRGVAPNARDASRRAVDFLAVASDDLHASGEILWRNLATREEQRVALREIVM